MSITSKGRRWRILHSLWVGWTFTFGFFNWIAFFYVGIRAKRRRWLLWGLLYSVPFAGAMLYTPITQEDSGWLGTLWFALFLILAVVSIIHAFLIRKEYLLRLEGLQKRRRDGEEALKRQLATEHEAAGARIYSSQEDSRPSAQPLKATSSPKLKEKVESSPSKTFTQSQKTSQEVRAPAPARSVQPAMMPFSLSEVRGGNGLDYKISSSYPFPLAFGYRSLASIVDPRDLYREQLRIAENMLAFLGSVSLTLLRQEDREGAGVDPREYWHGGISPGDWKDIVGRCSKVFAEEHGSLARAIRHLNIRSEKKGFGAEIAALIKVKNDYKHDRGPIILEDIAEAAREMRERLGKCMEFLNFLTAYPIRQVEDFDVSRRGEGVVLKCLRYTGDHPSFPQEEVPFDKALPRGDLFLDLGEQGWVPLFPFLTTMTCSHCKVRETYFVDAWDTRRGTARMKSFERGHTMLNREVSEALTEWASSLRQNAS